MKTPRLSNASKQRLTSHLDKLVNDGKIPGIQYVVVDATSTLFQYSGGLLDASDPMSKVQEDSKFLSSSSTKVLTAVAIHKLCETNKVMLDASLSEYYASHPYGEQVTILQLLNHSSGIPNPLPVDWIHVGKEDGTNSNDEDKALQEILEKHSKLQSTPGEKFAYANLSYWLLGKVIEQVSGMRYSEYMKKEVFAPLGITEDEMGFDRSLEATYAQGHQERFSILSVFFTLLTKRELWDESSGKWARFQKSIMMDGPAYGGCIGTAIGYAKVLQDMILAMESNGAESKLFTSSAKQLIAPQYSSDGSTLLPSTLGGFAPGKLGQQTYYTKVGGGPGFGSNIRIYPEAGIATVYLSNKTEVSEGPVNAFLDRLDENLFT